MKRLCTGLFALVLFLLASFLFLVSSQGSGLAQAVAGATSGAGKLGHEEAEEVTLTGTVAGVLPEAAPGMTVGSHLMLATPSGALDASLGRFGLRGAGAVSVAAGQEVEVTGVLKTIKGKTILMVRTVKAGGAVYTVRNRHGFPVSPQARQRAGQKMGQKGESL